MSKKKIWRVAVIGCGSFACGQYLPNISKEANAVCVAVVDIIYERATAAAERFGVPNAYHDVYELIEKCEFDIAIDAASIQAHHEINTAILRAGKHLISQKPAAPTVREFREQTELASKAGVKFACVPIHPMRYDLNIAGQMLRDGTIGNPTYIKCNLAHGGPEYFQYRDADPSWFYEDGAGALVDMGVHGLQIVTTVFGPVRRFSCLGTVTTPHRTVRSGAFDGKEIVADRIPDQYLILLEFVNGRVGFVDTGFSQKASRAPQLEIFGDAGTICISKNYMDNLPPEVYLDAPERGIRGWITPMKWTTVPEKLNSQCCCLRDLIRSIESDTDPVLSPAHACHVLDIMCRIPEAIRTGGWVETETTF